MVQLTLSILVAVVLPVLARFGSFSFGFSTAGLPSSFVAATVAVASGLLIVRKVTAFPGTRALRYVLPAFVSSYGIALACIFALRLEYSRIYFASSFLLALTGTFAIASYLLHRVKRLFYIVPGTGVEACSVAARVAWIALEEPRVPHDRNAVIVADFRQNHPPEWERMLAEAAVQGHLVYHSKQLLESLTGRVTIEHLSENSFGSLLPNLAWRKIKRAMDLLSALALLPFLLPLFGIIAVLIKLDTSGPVLFRQFRMGAGGKPFRVFKFRTMYSGWSTDKQIEARRSAMTLAGDPRITRVGSSLRRLRIDELPQIFNIILGQMSWIGPRPEAIPLSQWYEAEIPFYFYRHIVLPGISGWAQVNQGHVTDIGDVTTKLEYDFYYIKNFSVWLDILIALRTLRIVLTGFGSK